MHLGFSRLCQCKQLGVRDEFYGIFQSFIAQCKFSSHQIFITSNFHTSKSIKTKNPIDSILFFLVVDFKEYRWKKRKQQKGADATNRNKNFIQCVFIQLNPPAVLFLRIIPLCIQYWFFQKPIKPIKEPFNCVVYKVEFDIVFKEKLEMRGKSNKNLNIRPFRDVLKQKQQ